MMFSVGEVVEAQELFSGDQVLVGDQGVGISMFAPVTAVLIDALDVVLTFEGGQHITVKHNTEVVRLEQGKHTFVDGPGGLRTRRLTGERGVARRGADRGARADH